MIKNTTILILAIFVFTACTQGGRDREDGASKNTINVNLGNEPPTLDWSLATDSTSYTVLNNIMEGLTRFNENFLPEPNLSESWEMSEDGLTYTFKIREGVKWTDGQPLKAGDFEYSWKRLLNPATGGGLRLFSLRYRERRGI